MRDERGEERERERERNDVGDWFAYTEAPNSEPSGTY